MTEEGHENGQVSVRLFFACFLPLANNTLAVLEHAHTCSF